MSRSCLKILCSFVVSLCAFVCHGQTIEEVKVTEKGNEEHQSKEVEELVCDSIYYLNIVLDEMPRSDKKLWKYKTVIELHRSEKEGDVGLRHSTSGIVKQNAKRLDKNSLSLVEEFEIPYINANDMTKDSKLKIKVLLTKDRLFGGTKIYKEYEIKNKKFSCKDSSSYIIRDETIFDKEANTSDFNIQLNNVIKERADRYRLDFTHNSKSERTGLECTVALMSESGDFTSNKVTSELMTIRPDSGFSVVYSPKIKSNGGESNAEVQIKKNDEMIFKAQFKISHE